MNAKKDSVRKKTQKSGMGRSALRLLVSLAAGGAAGFGISWAVSSARGGMRETAENLSLAFQENAWIFQTAFFLVLTAGGSNPRMLLSVALFLGFCIVILFLEAALVRQIQKANPMKRGDIGSLRFNRDWLESCDEAERLGIYKASWKSFQVMNSLCPVMEAVALLGKIMFDTGNFPIILVTFLWAVQTGVYCFYSAQYDRRGAGE